MTNTDLGARTCVLLRDVVRQRILPLSMPSLKRAMAFADIPIIRLADRKSAIRLTDLDELIERSARPPIRRKT